MPLYEYECESCHHRFERIQKFSDPLADTCPECGGLVRKLLSSPAIRFKGTGWYVTDYARKGQPPGDGTKAGPAPGKGGAEAAGASNEARETKAGSSAGSTPASGAGSRDATAGGAGSDGSAAGDAKPST